MTLLKKTKTDWAFFLRDEMYPYIDGFEHSDKDVAKHCEKLAEEIANTVTAVLDEVESEAGDLYLESDDENYQRALTDIKAFIRKGIDMNNTHQALIEETKPKLVNTFVLSDDSWDVILQDTIDTVIEGERKQAALIVEEMMEDEEHWKPITNRILDKTPPNKV